MNKVFLITFALSLLIVGCSTTKTSSKRLPSYHIDPETPSKLSAQIEPLLKKHPGKSGAVSFADGLEAFQARMNLVGSAEHTLDLQYYIWKDDYTGKLLMKNVVDAAQRGVRVRLLLDNLVQRHFQRAFYFLDQLAQVEIRIINPGVKYVNHRMHNKSFIVDNKVAIVGGRNIADEYFQENKEMNYFDYDVLMVGPVVNEVSKEFDEYWNSDRSVPITEIYKNQDEREVKKAEKDLASFTAKKEIEKYEIRDHKIYWGDIHVFYDPPAKLTGKHNDLLTKQLGPDFKETKKEIYFISPYFIPGKEGMKTFKALKKKGVHVYVLTNSLSSSDVPSVYAGYKKYRKDLLKYGVELYEIRRPEKTEKKKDHFGSSSPTGLHGKVIIKDRETMFAGSMNLDPRSKDLNTEMGVVIDNKEMVNHGVENLKDFLPKVAYKLELKDGEIVWKETIGNTIKVHKKEPGMTKWKSFKAWMSSHLMPESVL